MNILIADDNVDHADTLARTLQLQGHQTRVVYDGREALLTARDYRPDAMILDIAMPGLDGHSLAQHVRAEPWGTGVLLVAASAMGAQLQQQMSRAAGFDHHLVKPVQIERLYQILAQFGSLKVAGQT
jgi:CheY-like chemotaxis protein